jgi:hypothetical protein
MQRAHQRGLGGSTQREIAAALSSGQTRPNAG